MLTQEFPICDQHLPATCWKALQEASDQSLACGRVAAATVGNGFPDERKRESLQDDTQHQKVQGLGAMLPVRTVHGEDQLSWGQEGKQDVEEHLARQLLILKAPL
ncbi:hypothetical protein GCM10010842_38980 [Deinococcus daejeonensis]|uniref:Uncharacterized protein n=1 Tax=Deinococcus daejeonensis TaxID=1007098 RepID=A0ABQ2JJA0_9DEIO|nr:hypothetical protein GCM10010842_38980 [Deinococcus daejeonensis]